ncbi:Uncharacterised protein [Salmonella enterica subsp. enterica serovar Bovismorbificans]|uniref:Uncharacterized protein n=1 Tax=Salmonella enterica subsp. enterica serovar Bovismorbificans TaxID=58097 RepID=A0A655C5E7_SALET|nr:Uncharacterised protein [Salmonella enterica subsp. enterica serovar Bovismorbificans]
MRQGRERFAYFRLPLAQRRQGVRQQCVLITGVSLPPADANILYRHQKQPGAGFFCQFDPQSINDLLRRLFAFAARLQRNKHHAAIHPRAAGKTSDIIHRRIVANNFHKILQLAAHGLERDALVSLNTAHQHAGILLRKECFRDGDIKPDVQRNGAKKYHPDKTRMVKHPF